MGFIEYLLILAVYCILLGIGPIFDLHKYIEPQLLDVATLKDVRLQIPMQIYNTGGELIAQYGKKRHIPVTLQQIPPELMKTLIATKDNRFHERHGVDPVGIFRATNVTMLSGHASRGISTITQQLVHNFFLSPEKTLMRKIEKTFLAIRIERLLNKDEILELYLNKIYLGYRAYDVGAAAQVYFGRPIDRLALNEMTVVAGLPKASSTFNPLYPMGRITTRCNVVLSRVLSEGYITQTQHDEARSEAIDASYHVPRTAFSAPYLSEMVRQEMMNRYGKRAYEDDYWVYTAITRKSQWATQQAVRSNVPNYDVCHGYRGPASVLQEVGETPWETKKIIDSLKCQSGYGPLFPTVVTFANAQEAVTLLANGDLVSLTMDGMRWARRFISDTQQGATPRRVDNILRAGQQIWIREVADDWWLSQVPSVNSALVSINSQNDVIVALVGGSDFNQGKFNRVTQALRQIGSNIRPFLYTAAVDKGLTLASMFNNMPISRWDAGAGSDWQPKNSPPQYTGPIRLHQRLGQSKNVVMMRAMRAMGVDYVAEHLQRFGFPAQSIVHTESLAPDSTSSTPLQITRGYSMMANGGFLVDPFLISEIENGQGGALFEEHPKIACPQCDLPIIYGNTPKSNILGNKGVENIATSTEPQNGNVPPQPQLERASRSLVAQSGTQKYAPHVINTPLSFLVKSALSNSVFGEPGWMGTDWHTEHDLQRHDIGGKAGTINSSKDAWFSGYGLDAVTSVWIGFDSRRRDLGRTTASGAVEDQISDYEGGAKSAQPAWDSFMRSALGGVPEESLTPLPGIVTVNIDRGTGQSANGGNNRTECFIEGTQPARQVVHEVGTTLTDGGGETHELF